MWLEGEDDKAEAQLVRVDIAANNKAYALRILGRVQMDEGDFVTAQQVFERALQLSPQDSLIWTDFARLRFARLRFARLRRARWGFGCPK